MAMFGKKKKEQQPAAPVKTPAAQNDTTYFGKNLSITGKVSGQGNLIILGTFDGEFDLRGEGCPGRQYQRKHKGQRYRRQRQHRRHHLRQRKNSPGQHR